MAKGSKKGTQAKRRAAKEAQQEEPVWESRILQVSITCVILLVFWNLLDFILDEYVTHEGYVFDVYYDLLLPLIVGLAVELFPKKRK